MFTTPRQIEAGVPQGSCLSPLLYVHYINDHPLHHQVKTAVFADDTMFHSGHVNKNYAILRLQKQIDLSITWLEKWWLKLNADKTEAIIFGSIANTIEKKLKINNQTIDWKNKIKYLGVLLDNNLSMSSHTRTTINKARGARATLYPILNSKSHVPLKTGLQIYSI